MTRRVFKSKAVIFSERVSIISPTEVSKTIETILAEKEVNIIPSFFRTINPGEEFGVSRFIADRMYHLPQLLDKLSLQAVHDDTYLVTAEAKDSRSNVISLEYRFRATNIDEAESLYRKISHQLAGIQLRIWLSCWCLGNQLGLHTFSCALTDLMQIAYPGRMAYFNTAEKTDFYEHLKSLEQAKLAFSKRREKRGGKNLFYQKIEIPLIQIHEQIVREGNPYPQQLTITIMNDVPATEKMAYVGAAFKHRTLELNPEDVQLATWIQLRKAQHLKKGCIRIDINYLFKLAGLQKTAESNKGHAKTLLIKKLRKLAEKKIICCAPEKLDRIVLLKIR